MKVKFVFIGEGPSDTYLIPHIEDLVIRAGAEEVKGEAPDFSVFSQPVGASVEDKLKASLSLYTNVDFFVIHRDADNDGIDPRRQEIEDATTLLGVEHWVPVVPVKMIESWLLADREKIKDVAGCSSPGVDLGLPALKSIEKAGQAKDKLKSALFTASGLSGRKLEKFKKRFCEMRMRLLNDLDGDGPVQHLPSYKAFHRDLHLCLTSLGLS